MSIWFTSDTHYYHKKIIEFCDRPFKTVEEMNEAMIERHNSVVKPEDTVYHLGDFAFASPNKIRWLRGRLHGKQVLILGNHDRDPKYSGIEKLREIFDEMHYDLELRLPGIHIVMYHFPIESWNKRHKASVHLHGHTHGTYDVRNKEIPNRFDVGVDSWNYTPVSLEQILKLKIDEVEHDRYAGRKHGD